MSGTIRNPGTPRKGSSGRKRCVKGKSCRASCINRQIVCRVELGGIASKSLSSLRKIRNESPVAAHPNLAKDYSEANIRKALDQIATLDKDASRRVGVLKKLFGKTKTVFIDWKDEATNRKVFVEATSKIHADPLKIFNDKVATKTWSGVAFGKGSTIIKSSPGFKPSAKQILSLVTKQLKEVSEGKRTPYSIGKGTKALGNNSLVTLIHELGHHGHFAAKEAAIGPNLKNLSFYAEVNNKEKFAELFTAYIFAGPRLRALYPMEYEAVENVLSKGGLL